MALSFALALSLALLQPDTPQTPASDAPVATGAPAEQPAAPAQQPPAEPAEGAVPTGAPADDYGLVNWCWGALRGHMALYPRVQDQLPEADRALDEQMLAAGRDYLNLYERAIAAADAASTTPLGAQAAAARSAGTAIWNPAQNADPTSLKWAFLGWSLPGRCETAANRLLTQSELLAPALRSTPAAAGPGVMQSAPAETPAEPAAQPTEPTAEPATPPQ